MSRKRLRPDYVIRNYSYACKIMGPVPQIVWNTARKMQWLWNGLVEMHDKVLDGFSEDTTKQQKTAAYDAFWRNAYTFIKDTGDAYGLSCWQKWHVLDTFKDSQKRWSKKRSGKPSSHYGLKRILIPHRTDPGGVDAEWLYTDHDRKHTAILEPTEGHHWRDAYMTIGGERVQLRVLLHREIPEGAILKRVALVGRYEPSFRTPQHNGWEWEFLASIEMPAPEPAKPARRAMALDLGWRVREDGIRVAVVTDGEHFWEWILPFDLSNAQMRRRQRFYAERGLTLQTTGNWRELWDMQSSIDMALEDCKRHLRNLDITAWPEEAKLLMAQLTKVRATGLRHLRRTLEESGIVIKALTIWEEAYTLAIRRRRGAEIHCQRSRNHLYRHLADWLARHADIVSWEGNLDLKRLAEEDSDSFAIRHGQKYRQIAGLSVLRQYIRESVAKYGRTLLDVNMNKTSRICSVCFGEIAKTSKLEVSCDNGHFEDTDINSSLNLYRAIPVAQRRMLRELPQIDREQLARGLRRLA